MDSQLPAAGVFASVLALFGVIFWARRKGTGFTTVTLAALAAGVVVGIVAGPHTGWIEPIGKIYLGLLSAMVAPLIIVSILASVTSLGTL